MLPVRPSAGTVGRTRTCPHCKATILESAVVCPQCRHHLRFGAAEVAQPKNDGFSALRVEGSIEHPDRGGDWEYSVVLTIRNERGEELARQVVGVGALRPTESRTFTLSVDVQTPGGRRR
jgi:acetyl-CoA carboxylase beta subunit